MIVPVANKIEHRLVVNSEEIVDEYAWLRDPEWPNVKDPKIIEYLQVENKYTDHYFEPLQSKKDEIFNELKSRIKLADQSPYTKEDNFYYYSRTEEDKDYPIYCRKAFSVSDPEEIILDVNVLAKDKKFTNVGYLATSPDHTLLAYSVDFTGDEKFTLKIYNLKTQEYLADEINNIGSKIIWHETLGGLFYMPLNEQLRQDKVMFHFLGVDNLNDKLIFQISDPLYQLVTSKSSSKKYIFIEKNGHSANEIHAIRMNDDTFQPKLIKPLKENIFYDVKHNGNNFYIKTNENAKNFQIVIVDENDFENDLWNNEFIAHDPSKYLSSFSLTKNYLLLNYRDKGIPLIKVTSLQDKSEKVINFPDPSFTAFAKSTNFEEDDIRIDYSSLARPNTTYSYDFTNDKLTILKVQEIPSGFDAEEYKVERIFADSEEVKIPVTLLYKKSLFKKDGTNPVYLYGYGSYGYAVPVSFKNNAISLVNRGFVYVIAHIRGGDDLGFYWYESAKFLNKKRTFLDFIAASEALIRENYTSENNIVICGGSAGGLLIGAVINERPELFKAAIAHVPFVDVLNTMLDESLPLTPGEFKEWGNPKEPEFFSYIKSYSPYDNVKSQNYPSLYVTAGLSDPRVSYWEAAKWVAKLREKKSDSNILLLKTNMDSGHYGASGRFDYLKEAADDIVFIISVFGI
ncbi:protease 2 [Hydra vulgaris]|uniref:protease 2 n=1 Tax=Hydra vulgaris TaxID=6087 RepID=UPI001F5F4EEE|nr:protease 2 [Hydra vulgaris]